MQKRLGIVLGLIVAYRFLAHVPVPLAEPSRLKDIIQNVVSASDFGGFLNILTGGALAQLSIVLIGRLLTPALLLSSLPKPSQALRRCTKMVSRADARSISGRVSLVCRWRLLNRSVSSTFCVNRSWLGVRPVRWLARSTSGLSRSLRSLLARCS